MASSSSSQEEGFSDESRGPKKKLSRENTPQEKRTMNKLRRKRKKCKKKLRAKVQELKKEVSSETVLRKQAERSVSTYRQISRTYWERWRWELHKRRESMLELRTLRLNRNTRKTTKTSFMIHEIDPSMLKDPIVGLKAEEIFLARGCFGIVRLQQYRSLQVAVKEFLPRSLTADVRAEASVLASLAHPYVPFLFGICTKSLPLRIVMQYHTVCGRDVSTMERELHKGRFLGNIWIILCAQLMEVLRYLHEEVGILHNDIKGDNVLLSSALNPEDCQYQIVLIDFGKATKVRESKRYHLTSVEKSEYIRKYPHIPPEVIEGEARQSKWSDVYAVGRLMYQISDSGCIDSLESHQKVKFTEFAQKCRSTVFSKRPGSIECLDFFEQL